MSNRPPPSYQETVGQVNSGFQPPGYGSQAPPAYDPRKGPVNQPYPPQGGYQQTSSYQQHTVLVQPQQQIIVVGGCPSCRIGVLEEDFTCLGVCCAILFFPLGIICCLAMKQRRCPHCEAVFG